MMRGKYFVSGHVSLGFTEQRKALFMPPRTIYMYYARGRDSLNISCQGKRNAALIKSAIVFVLLCLLSRALSNAYHYKPGAGFEC